MGHWLRLLPYGFMLLGFLVLTGCPSPATQPGSPLPPQPAPPGRGETETGTRDSREPATGPSSLDQARLGERPSTPASSPLKEIYFDYDRYDVNSDSRQVLKLNADWLKVNPSARVEIEGHADERGTNEYNLALGARRAQSARDYLVTLGISAERLSTISYGEELPVCKEARDDCWQRNRRARFVIITRRPAS